MNYLLWLPQLYWAGVLIAGAKRWLELPAETSRLDRLIGSAVYGLAWPWTAFQWIVAKK